MGDDQTQQDYNPEEASLATVQEVIKTYNFSLRETIRYIDALKKAQQSLTYLCHDWGIYKTVFDGESVEDPEALAYLFTFDVVLPFLVGVQIDNAVAYHSIITDAVVDKKVKERFITNLEKIHQRERAFPSFLKYLPIDNADSPNVEYNIGTALFSAIFPLSQKGDYEPSDEILSFLKKKLFTDDLRKNLMLALSGLRAGHGLYRQFVKCKNVDFYLLDSVIKTTKTGKSLSAGDVMTITLGDGVNLEMVYCPAGTFTMGSPEGELGRLENETRHKVTLTEGFWIGKYEVTQGQYKAITGENPSHFKGDTRPVEMVSWRDSVAFCERLNELKIAPEGYRFALPTEAQWEYACRAGTTTALNNGKPITSEWGECPNLDEVGWYDGNTDGQTHPIGEKRPNAWGIYDMHGNVWEWCMDCCDWTIEKGVITDTYKDGVVDPVCSWGVFRVLRGGSWGDPARFCRSADRVGDAPDCPGSDSGFRLVLIPEQKTASP